MAQSLLAHLYSRIRGSQEDIATIALQYLLSQSDALNSAFTHLLSNSLGIDLDDNLRYFCQAVGDDQERPDMAGIDSVGREQVLCEMKFYAGLTHNQPLSYLDRLKEKLKGTDIRIFPVSAATRKNFQELIYATVDKLETLPPIEPFYEDELYVEETEETPFVVEKVNGSYVLTGKAVERLIDSVNFGNEESLNYFHRMLRRWGAIDALRNAGAQEGDSVIIADMEFDFVE